LLRGRSGKQKINKTMKRILFSLLLLAPFFASAQNDNFKWIKQQVWTASGTDTYTVTMSGMNSYVLGFEPKIRFTNANTGAATLQVGILAAIPLKKNGGVDLVAGDIPAGATFRLSFDGTNFQVLGIGGAGGGVSLSANNTWTGNNAFTNNRVTVATTTYTILSSDWGKSIDFTSATDVTVTLPNGLATGFNCSLYKQGTGDVIVTATGTLEANASPATIEVLHAGAYVEYKGSNVWEATGQFGTASGTGTVTSVAASVPSIFSISGSPITTSGTLAITYSGTALPVANGGTGITALGTGVATALGANVSGSGSIAMTNSPVFTTPNIGTATGSITGNAATVTTNANLTGDVTSVGNSTTISAGAVDIAMLSATGTPSGSTYLRGDNTWAAVGGGGTWGSITGTLSSQTDLQTALDARWSLASGGTLTGVNTISNPTANGLIYSGSPTFSADGHYHTQFLPTLQFGSTLAHVQGALNIGGTYTAGVNNQILRGLVINPTYAYGAFTRTFYSQLGLDIRDGGTANGGFKFYTDAFTNTTNAFQMISRTGVTTFEMGVDSGAGYMQTNSGKGLTLNSGSTFRISLTSSRVLELASGVATGASETVFGPAWSGTATTSTATQQNSNSSLGFQGRGWNGAAAVTTYLFDNFRASTVKNLLFTSDRRFWNGSATTDIWRITSTGMMFLGGITDPTATLHIAAGTATRAPFKLTSGTNLTTPEAGALEYNGTDLLFTPASTRSRVVLQTSEINNNIILDANSSRKNYTLKFFDGSGATGNQDYDLFSGLSDAVIEVKFKVVGIKNDGSEIYTCTKSASFKKDGAAAPVLVGSVTTIAEVVEDGTDNPNTTISIASGLVRLAFNTGSADVYQWTVFAEVTQTIL
jgi:hypothetical protein